MGSMRHMEMLRESEGVEEYYNLSDEDRETAASLSYRATLAILRFFKSYPIRSYVWKGAARETPSVRVEMQINDGPWCVIGPKGLPLTQG